LVNFNYYLPVDISFGRGIRNNIHNFVDKFGKKAFLIADPAISQCSIYRDFVDNLGPTLVGIWNNVQPNPELNSVQTVADKIENSNVEFVIAVGGGSTIDAAKAAALAAKTSIPIEAYHSNREKVGNESLPLIAIPTTSGTGSEVTPVSVLTDIERGVKAPIVGEALLPRKAIIDPEWTLTMPPVITAATGMDALSHALEAYWSTGSVPICDALAEKATVLILRNLHKAYTDGEDVDAREKMSLGSLLAGMAFSLPKTAAVHACSYPLTQRFGLSHGVACAFTLDSFIRFNAQIMPDKLNHLAKFSDLKDAIHLADKVSELKSLTGLPQTLKQAGIKTEDIDVLVAESFHPNINNNPRKVTPNDLKQIYQELDK